MNVAWELKLATVVDVAPTVKQLSEHMNDSQREVFRDKLERYVRKPDRDLILAVQDEQILGLVCVIEQAEFPATLAKKTLERLGKFGCTTQLLVHPRARKRGIGNSLQNRAEKWARERGRVGIWLVTHRMAYWYQNHFGYAEVGKISVKDTEKSIMAKEFR